MVVKYVKTDSLIPELLLLTLRSIEELTTKFTIFACCCTYFFLPWKMFYEPHLWSKITTNWGHLKASGFFLEWHFHLILVDHLVLGHKWMCFFVSVLDGRWQFDSESFIDKSNIQVTKTF